MSLTTFTHPTCYANLSTASTMSLLQADTCPLIGDRLIKHSNGDIEILPKSLPFIVGEKVVRPLINASTLLCEYVWTPISRGFSLIDNLYAHMFNFIPKARAALISDWSGKQVMQIVSYPRLARHDTCTATWLNHLELMCRNRKGGIVINPVRSYCTDPQSGIVVALKGFSKRFSAFDFCSNRHSIVKQYLKENSKFLTETTGPEPYLGVWYNRINENVYLDRTVVFNEEDLDQAIAFAREQNQIAVHQLSESRDIPVGGTGDN